jgi:class 3 adenylate cyclase
VGLKQDLETEVDAIFRTQWHERDGRKVPEPEDVKLGNDAVKLDGTVLYADLADSTNLVKDYKWWFGAEVYKAYLVCACRIIRQNGGVITAFDGDRVMAVYIGDGRDAAAVRSAMQINYATTQIVTAKIEQVFPPPNGTPYHVKQGVGIDRSVLYAVRTGIRGSNDLVWVGMAANIAAKMSMIRDGYATHITHEVYQNLDDSTTYGGTPRQNMWSDNYWVELGTYIHRSTYWWEP